MTFIMAFYRAAALLLDINHSTKSMIVHDCVDLHNVQH